MAKCAKWICLGMATAAFLLFTGVPATWGQGEAYITGRVTDQSGAVVPGATVVILNEGTGIAFTVKTTSSGIYRSPSLTPGNYTVTISASGFQKSVTTGAIVQVGSPTTVDITLQVGAVTQTVEVQAAVEVLRTENAGLGGTVSYHQVENLPYFNRSAGVVLSLAPSVRYTGEDVISYGASRYNVGGFTNVNMEVDGASVIGDRTDVAQMTLNPSVESLTEVKVNESQYSAKYGKDAGALVQMQTKSGTNSFHGGVYDYERNTALDTYNGFTRTKPVDLQHQFGGTVGGPIKRDKLFFFTSLEKTIQSVPAAFNLTVPTAAMKNGDFSQLTRGGQPVTIIDPQTGQPFSGNIIPSGRFDPVAVNAIQFVPDPSVSGFDNNLPQSTGVSYTRFRGTSRFDFNLNPTNNVSFVVLWDHVTNRNLGAPAYNAISPAASPTLGGFGFEYLTQSYNTHWTHIVSPTLVWSNAVVYRPRWISRLNPSVDPAAKWAETLGIKNYAGARLPESYGGDLGFPSFNFSGYTGLGPGFLLFQENPIRELSWDTDVTWVHGKHSFKMGFSTEYNEHGAPDQSTPTGIFSFSPVATSGLGFANSGDAIASFLLGLTDNANTTLGPLLDWKEMYYAGYFEDDYKVTSQLTLNLGVRLDVDAPVYETECRGNTFSFSAINPVSGTNGAVQFLGPQNARPCGFYNTAPRIAPRFGFAYHPFSKVVVRGGYGVFNTNPVLGANRRAPSLGWTTSASFSTPDGGFTPAFLLQNGFPDYPLGGDPAFLNEGFGAVPQGQSPNTSPTFVQQRWKFGYVQNMNLSVQYELPWNSVLEVAGQGSLGRNLSIFQNWNEVPPEFWGLAGSNVPRRPFPAFNSVTQVKSQKGTTNYWNGYVRLDKRFSHGFTVIANYSYGRTIGFLGGSIYFPQLSHGPTIYDEANGATAVPYQTSTVGWTWDLPWGRGRPWLQSGAMSVIFGGWTVGGILTINGGVPFGISSGTDSLNSNGPLGGRANIVQGCDPMSGPQSHDHWFNTSCFATPLEGQIGNYGGTLLGPAQQRLDFSARKEFLPLANHENFKFTLGGEFFNFTNTLQFGPPNGNLVSAGFGRTTGPGGGLGANTTGPYGARQVQVFGRIDF